MLRRWLESESPLLGFDHESTERWMAVLGDRVEKGQSKRDIQKEKGKLPHQTLENLIFGDYLQWLSWNVSCVKNTPEETGTFKEFMDNDFLTKQKANERKVYKSLLCRTKNAKLEAEAAEKAALIPPLEVVVPEEVQKFEDWHVPQNLIQREAEEFDF